MNTNLKLRMHSIELVTSTGSDQAEKPDPIKLFLGCIPISPDGTVYHLKEIPLGEIGMDSIRKFAPGKSLFSFQGASGQEYTADFYVCLALFEAGKLSPSGAMQKIYELISGALELEKKEMQTQLVSAGPISVSTFSPGTLWPRVRSTVNENIIKQMASFPGVKMFPLQEAKTSMLNNVQTWNGEKNSPVFYAEFKSEDRVYKLTYDWELI